MLYQISNNKRESRYLLFLTSAVPNLVAKKNSDGEWCTTVRDDEKTFRFLFFLENY